jgi:hypothetical protein
MLNIFPLVKNSESGTGILPVCFDRLEACPTNSKHPAENGIYFDVIVAFASTRTRNF